jgi:hypothetical protein
VQPVEIDIIFPGTEQNGDEDGYVYEVVRGLSALDLPTAEITFEDPSDGGSVWRFFLDRVSAALNQGGGAVLNASQGDAVRDVMERVLVERAKTSGIAQPCPPEMQ